MHETEKYSHRKSPQPSNYILYTYMYIFLQFAVGNLTKKNTAIITNQWTADICALSLVSFQILYCTVFILCRPARRLLLLLYRTGISHNHKQKYACLNHFFFV